MKKQVRMTDSLLELFVGQKVIAYTNDLEYRTEEDGSEISGKLAYSGYVLGIDSTFLLLGTIDESGEEPTGRPQMLLNINQITAIQLVSDDHEEDFPGPVDTSEVN
jgi:hypothetical protein